MSDLLTGLEQVQALHEAEIKKLKGIIKGLLMVCDQTHQYAMIEPEFRNYCAPADTGWYQLAQEVLKK